MTAMDKASCRECFGERTAAARVKPTEMADQQQFSTRAYLLERYGLTMTPNNAGEVLHQHPSHIRALCQSGDLPAIRVGNRWHIPTVKFAAILDGFGGDA